MAEKSEDAEPLIDVITPLMQMAIVMHETYSAFRHAGFTEAQAMQLTSDMAAYQQGSEDLDEDD